LFVSNASGAIAQTASTSSTEQIAFDRPEVGNELAG
jgi:hypothetical protein